MGGWEEWRGDADGGGGGKGERLEKGGKLRGRGDEGGEKEKERNLKKKDGKNTVMMGCHGDGGGVGSGEAGGKMGEGENGE